VQAVNGPRATLCATLPSGRIGEAAYDIVLSNSLLHHLHDPAVPWGTIKSAAKPGATVLVMDLFRPPSEAAAAALVTAHAATAPEVLRRDFHNSLLAAFTPEEVEEQLGAAGLEQLRVERVSDRHLAVGGRI
jgi:2-polyprenyl-3-methyl-5-hydroxy-6-metoxy-1,4-benzoquinol methylase